MPEPRRIQRTRRMSMQLRIERISHENYELNIAKTNVRCGGTLYLCYM